MRTRPSLLTLATPLFIIGIYSQVIPTHSTNTLIYYIIGMLITVIALSALYLQRNHIMATYGTKLQQQIGALVFQHLLSLSPAAMEGASVNKQIARLRDFSHLQEFFSSQLFLNGFDLPFAVIFLIAIAIIGGALVWIPIIATISLLLVSILSWRSYQDDKKTAHQEQFIYDNFLLETIESMSAIKRAHAAPMWQRRNRAISADLSLANYRVNCDMAWVHSLQNFIIYATGLLMLAFGTLAVLDQRLSVGALIALIILIWRYFAPIKVLLSHLPRLFQFKKAFADVRQFLAIKSERPVQRTKIDNQRLRGTICLENVGFRYRNSQQPAMLGINLTILQGSMIAITGKNSSGRSTIAKMLTGLCQHQVGSITWDNINILQIDPIQLRRNVSYCSRYPELFYGSLKSNLLLAQPDASDEEIIAACVSADILDDIHALPDGFNTKVDDVIQNQQSVNFIQRLCVARALLKRSPVLILEDPGRDLNVQQHEHLRKVLTQRKGIQTIIIITHNPEFIAIADQAVLIKKGQLVMQDSPEKILKALSEAPT